MNKLRRLFVFSVLLIAVRCLFASEYVVVGDEIAVFRDSDPDEVSFLGCSAVATRTSTGITLYFSGDVLLRRTVRVSTSNGATATSIIQAHLNGSGKKLTVVIPGNCELMIEADSGPAIHSNQGLEIVTDNLLGMSGCGSLSVWGVGDKRAISSDGDLRIGSGLNVLVNTKHQNSSYAYSGGIVAGGSLSIFCSRITVTGYSRLISAKGNLDILASLLSLTLASPDRSYAISTEGAAIRADGVLRAVASVISISSESLGISADCTGGYMGLSYSHLSIRSMGDCLRVRGASNPGDAGQSRLTCSHASINAVSVSAQAVSVQQGRAVSLPDWPSGSSKAVVSFDGGTYMLSTKGGRPCVWCDGSVTLEGGSLMLCSKDSDGICAYDFTENGGQLKLRGKSDFSTDYKVIMSEAAVVATLNASQQFRTWTDTDMQFLMNMWGLFISSIVNVSGKPQIGIHAHSFTQMGGQLDTSLATYGYLDDIRGIVFFDRPDRESAMEYIRLPVFSESTCNAHFFFRGNSGNNHPEFIYEMSPVNPAGHALTHVEYEPYWIDRSIGASESVLVTFDGDSGQIEGSTMRYFSVGSLYGELPMVTREGYAFQGWFTARGGGGRKITAESVVRSEDRLLYAFWKDDSIMLTYSPGPYATGVSITDVKKMGVAATMRGGLFNRQGYRQTAWKDAGGRIYSFGASYVTDASITFYPVWGENTYTIRYHSNDGMNRTASSGQVSYSTACSLLGNVFSRIGYSLLGWARSSSATAPEFQRGQRLSAALAEEDGAVVDLYAVWKPITYTVRFDANNGWGSMSEQTLVYDAATNLRGNNFLRTGYVFSGWARTPNGSVAFTDGQMRPNVASTDGAVVTLYAVWVQKSTVTITFEGNGGLMGGVSRKSLDCKRGLQLGSLLPTASRIGYVFAGWLRTDNGSRSAITSNSIATEDMTCSASWRPITYTVRFDANGGTGTMADQSVSYDSGFSLHPNAYAHVGYAFAGWSTVKGGSARFSDGATVSVNLRSTPGDIWLYAVWVEKSYTIILDARGGMVEDKACATIVRGKDAVLGPLPTPVRKGYRSAGWYTDPSLGRLVTDSDVATDGMSRLYVHWSPNVCRIRYHANASDATGEMPSQVVPYDTSVYLVKNAFTKLGAAFVGWANTPDGAVVFRDGATVKNLTDMHNGEYPLYAVWRDLAAYQVVYSPGSRGLESSVVDVKYQGVPLTLRNQVFTCVGAVQVGWSRWENGPEHYAFGGAYTKDADEELFPAWDPNHYKIRFAANGGSGAMDDFDCTYWSVCQLPACTFTRVRYTFRGWATNSIGPVVYESRGLVRDLTPAHNGSFWLYAVWEETSAVPDGGPYTRTVDGLNWKFSVSAGEATVLSVSGPSAALANVTVPEKLGCVPVRHIGDRAVAFKTELKSVTLPRGIRSLGESAFADCPLLTTVKFVGGWLSVGNSAFYGDEALLSVELPDGTTSIGSHAFCGCSAMSSFRVPRHLSEIGYGAFSEMKSLEMFVQDVANSQYSVLDGVLYSSNGKLLVACPAKRVNYVIPECAREIGDKAFSCFAGMSLTIPENVLKIGEQAFESCSDLALTFEGTPPACGLSAVCGCRDGYYVSHRTEWESVIVGGRWNGLPVAFLPLSFDVSFDLCGKGVRSGGGALYQTVAYDGSVSPPTVELSEGYSFIGWDSDLTRIRSSKTIRAKYSLTCYSIGYEDVRGRVNRNPSSYTVEGAVVFAPLADTDDAYFVGWQPTRISQGSTGDRTVTAQWRAKEFVTVSFDANGGEMSVTSNRYVVGEQYNRFPKPTLRGHKFCGWYRQLDDDKEVSEVETATRNLTSLVAHWKPIEYFLCFEPNGGYSQSYTVQTFTYGVPTNLLANVYRAHGKEFLGWSLTPTGAVEYVDRQGVCDPLFDEWESGCFLYAVWGDLDSYDVLYLPGQDGVGYPLQDLKYAGEYLDLKSASFTRPGYEQVGWSLTDGGEQDYEFGARYESDRSLTLYPVWRVNNYTVRYHPNWGQGVMDDHDFVYEESQNLCLNAFTRGESEFLGWSLTPTGTVAYADGACVSNLCPKINGIVTLYAVWRNLSGDDPAAGMGTYMVIDLSGGSETNFYPVEYLDNVPSGGWTDEHKTTKLVMRKVLPGTFWMGSPKSECGRSDNEDRHQVTLTESYYIGVFEVTRRQWELVMGAEVPCAETDAAKPKEDILYSDIRGTDAGRLARFSVPEKYENTTWPETSAVNAESFMGRIRQRTGMSAFDLPTEAEWEYACRAGTKTALNNGKNLDSSPCVVTDDNMVNDHATVVAVYAMVPSLFMSSSQVANVGTKKANAWGIYDMHGNVPEWCLDFYKDSLGVVAVTNPVGPAWAGTRVCRGGGWSDGFCLCRSASRAGKDPTGLSLRPTVYWGPEEGEGFRLALRALPSWQSGFTVMFDTADGNMSVTGMTFVAGRPYGSLPTPEREGCDFVGWFTDDGADIPITSETVARGTVPTLHARWKVRTYTVCFDLGGHAVHTGGGELVQAVEHGADALMPTFEPNAGWVFLGWSVPLTAVREDRKVQALWERKSYVVSYVPGVNGVGTGMTFVVRHGDSVSLQKASYTCPGYVQTGWATEDGGAQTDGLGATRVMDGALTLYPTWRLADEALRGKFAVVDLSGGAGASSYPMTRLDEMPVPSWPDAYKTTKLVLRRIEAGTFRMGSPDGEYGHASDENRHWTSVDAPFYIGVFEMTQRQWELLMGNRPSFFSNDSCYSKRPVEGVSCSSARECLKVLSRKTGDCAFALPHEVEWEYACRAGTETSLNSGREVAELNVYGDVFLPRSDYASEVARYSDNGGHSGWNNWTVGLSGGTAAVGSYRANAWGLYDMHGNVAEWCDDMYRSGENVIRGGSWNGSLQDIRSAARLGFGTSSWDPKFGFRVVLRSVARTVPLRVSLDSMGGTAYSAPKLCFAGEAYGKLPVPEKSGCTFLGWYTHPEGGELVVSTDLATEDLMTLYAHWDVLRFRVRFDLGEHGNRAGGGKLSQMVEAGCSALEPQMTAEPGYRFLGWSTQFAQVLEDVVVRARYGLEVYGITYEDTHGLAHPNPTTYTAEDRVCFSAMTNPPGWRFLGWEPAEIKRGSVGDTNVVARWEQFKYAVDLDGVVGSDFVYGQLVTVSTDTERTDGYTNIVCVGWVGTGDVPASGVGTQVTFAVTQASSLRWLYETNYWFEVMESGGAVTVSNAGFSANVAGCWAPAGTNVVLEVSDGNEVFWGWKDMLSGRMVADETSTVLDFAVDRACRLLPVFGKVGYSSVSFEENAVEVREGMAARLVVKGGSTEMAISVQLYLTFLSASASDLDLSKATVDGVTPKGGLKFPLTLSWMAGDTEPKTIVIPVKADKIAEDDELIVFQLANATGREWIKTADCRMTIRDADSYLTLQEAVGLNVRLSSVGKNAWTVERGNCHDIDGTLGLYHISSPALAPGEMAELSFDSFKYSNVYFDVRFTGSAVTESSPTSLSVECRDGYIPIRQVIGDSSINIGHRILRDSSVKEWKRYYVCPRRES